MASDTNEAQAHRVRQALRPYCTPALDANKRPIANRIEWLHGSMVTNRHEKRAALAEARKFRCDPNGDHGPKCPKYVAPDRRAVGPKAAA